MSSNPFFIRRPRTETCLTNATSSRPGNTGTLFKLFAADTTNGSRIESISACIVATQGAFPSQNVVHVYLTDIDGNSPVHLREGILAQVVVSANNQGPWFYFNFPGGLFLGTNSAIYVGQTSYAGVNDRMNWVAYGGDL